MAYCQKSSACHETTSGGGRFLPPLQAPTVDRTVVQRDRDQDFSTRRLCREKVKFAVLYSAQERSPFFRRNIQNGSGDVLAVSHADLAALEICYLDTISICMAQ
jgi:hypothetical protein